MKVVSNNGAASIIGGADKPIDMGISTDPEDQLMILNVLSNSLYTDKIAAVLREYGCNAADANVEAGRGNQPIEVRLPNKIDPTLAIRDFGYGMSEEVILTTFCRLGRSTKRNSNAFTGMLGIGSKAGFAYGDSFVVTSYTGGVKAVYNCFRDKGAPRLSKMHEGPTDAPDGIEVKVPIRMGDFHEFIEKAERIYRYFAVRPIIQGAQINWHARGVAEFKGTGWRYTGSGSSVAIMGNVAYDLNTSALPSSVGARLTTLVSLGVELDFEIGDLEIAANREGLQYKEHTIKSIVARLDVVANEVTKVFTDRISKAATLWEAHSMYGDNFEKMGQSSYGMRTLKEVVNQGLTWRSEKITTGRFYVFNKESLPGVTVVEYGRPRYTGGRHDKREQPETIYASKDTVLVINDLASKANSPARVKGFFENAANDGKQRIVTFTFADSKVQDKYWKARQLTGAPTILLSSIAPAVLAVSSSSSGPSAHRAKHSAKVFTFCTKRPDDLHTRSQWWETEQVDLANDAGVYVKLDRFYADLSSNHNEADPFVLFEALSPLRHAGLMKAPIIGIKAAMIPKLGSKWIRLQDHVRAQFDKWCVANLQAIADRDAAQAHKIWLPIEWASEFGANTAIHKYLEALHTMGKSVADANIVYAVRHRTNALLPNSFTGTLPKPTHDLNALADAVRKAYPLIHAFDKHSTNCWTYSTLQKSLPAVKEYVRFIGK